MITHIGYQVNCRASHRTLAHSDNQFSGDGANQPHVAFGFCSQTAHLIELIFLGISHAAFFYESTVSFFKVVVLSFHAAR